MAEYDHRRTTQVIKKVIEEVWAFATMPVNLSWAWESGRSTLRRRGRPGALNTHDAPRRAFPRERSYEWGFKSVHWHDPAGPTDIDVVYTLKIDETLHAGHATASTPFRPGESNRINFLAANGNVEKNLAVCLPITRSILAGWQLLPLMIRIRLNVI
ncbi:hypothetical protein ASPVEDRAFT_88990 [Aspergillus versicolor CBS 583.65]|uniref:Uncharacterized protein n=1 Tax=Aspergillus versicolor CBS 583.65 TaxID=1036611 RepID=A0A1L9Q1W3_ASPVE|nr:uncharacterized protein ASPVEDRAFT_88990 [Aspergillus versicolor CBS 583.65]OJJ07750.1 hypothetical protein ASPVEDRAFT_88990 [Aspergillus versicolor CBS 583.65]